MKNYIKAIVFSAFCSSTIFAADMSPLDFANNPLEQRQAYIDNIFATDPQGMSSAKITDLMGGLYDIQSEFRPALRKKKELEEKIQGLTKQLDLYKRDEEKSKKFYDDLKENFENFKGGIPFKLIGSLAECASIIQISHSNSNLRDLLQLQLDGALSSHHLDQRYITTKSESIAVVQKALQELSDNNNGFQVYNHISAVVDETERYLETK